MHIAKTSLAWGALALFVAGAALGVPALAQSDAAEPDSAAPAVEEAVITIDLNRLEQIDRGCRIDLVITNAHTSDVARFEVDWVFFDQDGVISNRTALELAPLSADRTAVKQFVVGGLDCTAINSALINSVSRCETAEGPIEGCQSLVNATSRGGVTLRR